MKLLLIAFTLTLSVTSFAQQSKLGQDSDPVAGDNSRCCRTGKCGDNMRLCEDTQIDAERSPKEVVVTNKKSNKKNKAITNSAQ